VLPEPRRAPAGSGDEDSWGWLVTFSDLVLQLFGFAVIAAIGATAARVATSAPPPLAIAPTAAVAASAAPPETAPATPEVQTAPATRVVHQVAALPPPVDPATTDDDALPAASPDEDRLPAAPDRASPTGRAPVPQDQELLAIGRYLEQLTGRDRSLAATVATRSGEVVVEIGAVDGFRPGSAEPVAAMKPLLTELRALVAAAPGLYVEISGHTDDVPIRTAQFPSNLELSLARASRIAHDLAAGDAALRGRISAAGHGEQRPIASNAGADGRARNRRVEIRLARRG